MLYSSVGSNHGGSANDYITIVKHVMSVNCPVFLRSLTLV